MKKILLMIVLALFIAAPAMASVVTLNFLDSDINVGESFDVEVNLNSENLGEELLAYGFNVSLTTGATYDSYSIDPRFDDDSWVPLTIEASAFPGVLDNMITLATLSFTAVQEGLFTLSLDGLFDGMFNGLYYDQSDLGFEVSAEVNINSAPVPEPGTMLLFGLGLLGLTRISRKKI